MRTLLTTNQALTRASGRSLRTCTHKPCCLRAAARASSVWLHSACPRSCRRRAAATPPCGETLPVRASDPQHPPSCGLNDVKDLFYDSFLCSEGNVVYMLQNCDAVTIQSFVLLCALTVGQIDMSFWSRRMDIHLCLAWQVAITLQHKVNSELQFPSLRIVSEERLSISEFYIDFGGPTPMLQIYSPPVSLCFDFWYFL